MRIERETVTWGVTQRGLALWIRMVALELGKTKLAGEAGAYAKRLVDEGYGTAHALAELDVEGLVDATVTPGCEKGMQNS